VCPRGRRSPHGLRCRMSAEVRTGASRAEPARCRRRRGLASGRESSESSHGCR
jgi:hypothetical protein